MIDEAVYRDTSTHLLPVLYRISMSILHSDADAQDAVQQALMKAWAAREKTTAGNYRAYLTRITINECRNIQRYRQRVYPVDEVATNRSFPEPDHTDVSDAIAELSEKLRTALLLKYMEGYSEKEIAHALQITAAAVKSRLFQARKELKKKLSVEVTFE